MYELFQKAGTPLPKDPNNDNSVILTLAILAIWGWYCLFGSHKNTFSSDILSLDFPMKFCYEICHYWRGPPFTILSDFGGGPRAPRIQVQNISLEIFPNISFKIWILRFIPIGLILRQRHISFKFPPAVKTWESFYGKGK